MELSDEITIYNQVQDKLKQEYPQGGFVVIKDKNILGVWENRNDAIQEAYETYGNTSFLVKNINDSFLNSINYSRTLNFNNVFSYNA